MLYHDAYETRRSKVPVIGAFITVLIVMTLVIAYVKPAKADPLVSLWEHSSNPERGMSLMRMTDTDGTIVITYEMPRTSLLSIGIRPGMPLFVGRRNGDAFEGNAFVFACGQSWPYYVTGYFTGDRLRLQGPAPIFGEDCYVKGLSYNDRNANLIFWFRGFVR